MLLLLDIDGVMVPEKSWKSPEILSDGFPAFSEEAVSVLNSLLIPSDTVLLTTSHRHRYTKEEWIDIFNRRNIKTKNISVLPNIGSSSRLAEILNWHNKNMKRRAFIIIDDDKSLNELPPQLKRRLIQTSSTVGLTEEKYRDLLRAVRVR